MMLVVIVITLVAAVAAAEQPSAVVTLQQGDIVGSLEKATNGRVYYAFKTIPYAKPPLGPLRLKDPEPAPGWGGIRNGSLPLPMCPQTWVFLAGTPEKKGQEDCLYLNVYTPRPYRSNLPVMVFIHGGAFMVGSAMGTHSPSLPSPLMKKDVVVVAMNYRIGALGFLSTGDSVLPGNLGLKDQTLALRWVQDNIRNFGGDPNQVTIFGVSAGGISCHLHVLSPYSKGLFQRAILQAGTALMRNVYVPARKSALSISKALNCTGEESQQLLSCFMKASIEDLLEAQTNLPEWHSLPLIVGIQVDGTFLPDQPATLIKYGHHEKVDLMIGWMKDESNFVISGLFSKKGEEALSKLNKNFHKVAPIILALTEEDDPIYLSHRVFFNYMDDLNVTIEREEAISNLMTDYGYEIPAIQSAEFHAKRLDMKTFLYKFEHFPEKSLFPTITKSFIQRKMSGHVDEMNYLFRVSPAPFNRAQDRHMEDIVVSLWTNFARTGNPTVNGSLGFRWNPVIPGQPLQYISLTLSPNMHLVDRSRFEFWSSLPTQTNKLLYPEPDRQDTYKSEENPEPKKVVSILSKLDTCSKMERSSE